MEHSIDYIEIMVLGWAHERNLITGTTAEKQALKLVEEVGELARAVLKSDREKVIDGIGDCMVVMTNLAEKMNLGGLGRCYWDAYQEIKDRKGKMINGTFVKAQEC